MSNARGLSTIGNAPIISVYQSVSQTYLNGTTDYIELYGHQGSGGDLATIASGDTTYLQATLIRGSL